LSLLSFRVERVLISCAWLIAIEEKKRREEKRNKNKSRHFMEEFLNLERVKASA